MNKGYYEPKEEGGFLAIDKDGKDIEVKIPSSVLRWIWNNKLVHDAIGVKNPMDAKIWFSQHPGELEAFRRADFAILECVRYWQQVMKERLENIVVQEKFGKLKVDESGMLEEKTKNQKEQMQLERLQLQFVEKQRQMEQVKEEQQVNEINERINQVVPKNELGVVVEISDDEDMGGDL